MKQPKYPRLSIRVSAELAQACKEAGAERVREALAILLSDKAPATVPIVRQTGGDVVRQTTADPPVVGQLSDKPTDPPWKAKLAEQIRKAEAMKAAKATKVAP